MSIKSFWLSSFTIILLFIWPFAFSHSQQQQSLEDGIYRLFDAIKGAQEYDERIRKSETFSTSNKRVKVHRWGSDRARVLWELPPGTTGIDVGQCHKVKLDGRHWCYVVHQDRKIGRGMILSTELEGDSSGFPPHLRGTSGHIEALKKAWDGQGKSYNPTKVTAPALPESKRKIGAVFKDRLKSGGGGPTMVVIPSGSFIMGGKRLREELPRHKVHINYSFAMGKFEITHSEFMRYCNVEKRSLCRKLRRLKVNEGEDRDLHPVINVSWYEANAFARWLSEETGAKYRLPSEAEWEYAARAGTHSTFWWGEALPKCRNNIRNGARFNDRRNKPSFCPANRFMGNKIGTAVVGSYSPNPFGLFDMTGNASEWTMDCWNPNYHGAPIDGSPKKTGNCESAPIRGGGWDYGVKHMQHTTRDAYKTKYGRRGTGFRLVREL